jgi:hypothetical protein
MSVHIRCIQLVHHAICKQTTELFQTDLIPCQNKQSRGVAIEAMHEL